MTICIRPKQTISTSGGGLGRLQMVLEPDSGWCVSEDMASKGVDFEMTHWLERGMKHSL